MRRLVAIVGLALGLAGSPPAQLPIGDVELPAGVDEIELPLGWLTDGRDLGSPTVMVRIGATTRPFMLDSGANSHFVDQELVAELALKPVTADVVTGLGGVTSTRVYRLPQAVLSGVATRVAPGAKAGAAAELVLDGHLCYGGNLTLFATACDGKLGGFIGAPLFQRLVVTIEPDRDRALVCRPEAYRAPAGAAVLPLQSVLGMPNVRIDPGSGRSEQFLVDTGAPMPLVLGPRFVERCLPDAHDARLPSQPFGGVGGMHPATIVRLARFDLAGTALSDVVTVLTGSDARGGIGTDPRRAGIIGMGILRAFRVTFDYPNARLLLEPIAGARPAGADFGFALRRDGTLLSVAYLVTGGSAEAAGVCAHDALVSVDGQPAGSSTAAIARRLAPLRRARFAFSRGSRTIDVELTADDWIPRLALTASRPASRSRR